MRGVDICSAMVGDVVFEGVGDAVFVAVFCVCGRVLAGKRKMV